MRATFSIDVHPYTDRGRREYQEDYFYTDPPMRPDMPWLGVVSDGMGGHQGGDLASKAGVHALKRAFEGNVARRMRTEEALVQATTEGHKAVLRAAAEANAVGNMGATVVAFVVDGSTLHWCTAGDSRLYLFSNEALEQLSRDFTLAEDMRRGAANGDWSSEDIENSPQKNALTSFMGTDSWRYDAGSRELRHGDVVVACSDGVYGTVDSDGIVAACRTAGGAPSAQQIVENLRQRVIEAARPNQDNSTAIVVRVVAPKRPATRVAPAPTSPPLDGEKSRLPMVGGIALALAGLTAAAVYVAFKADRPAPDPQSKRDTLGWDSPYGTSSPAPAAPAPAPAPPMITPAVEKPGTSLAAAFAEKMAAASQEVKEDPNNPDKAEKHRQLTAAHGLLSALETFRKLNKPGSVPTAADQKAATAELKSRVNPEPSFKKLDRLDQDAAQKALSDARTELLKPRRRAQAARSDTPALGAVSGTAGSRGEGVANPRGEGTAPADSIVKSGDGSDAASAPPGAAAKTQ